MAKTLDKILPEVNYSCVYIGRSKEVPPVPTPLTAQIFFNFMQSLYSHVSTKR